MSVNKESYRWDIQGLRALAVLAVVIFHINPHLLPGGYVGVDIFFVISGYLIMGFIWRDLKNNSFTLMHFYSKRIYRLFPALFVMVAVCSVAAYFILFPLESIDFFKSLIATLFYYSNFYFYTQSDYFNTAMAFSPLLHTWSLSVEEQFYMLFPFILIFIYAGYQKQIVKFLLVLGLCSLLLSEFLIYKEPTFSFFASPTRFFQFIIGGIISIALQGNPFSKRTNEIVVGVGLVIVVLTLFFYSDKTPFPGVYALLPSIGTGMILFSGKYTTVSKLVLTNSVAKLIGNSSYSIYLWHWPLIVFYKLKVSPNLSTAEQITLFILSLFLGYLSWRFVENNTRKKQLTVVNAKPFLLSVGATLLLSTSAYGIFHIFPHDNIGNKGKAYQYLDMNTTSFRGGKCFLSSGYDDIKFYDKALCVTYDKAKKNYLLIGDSHAAHYYSALAELLHDDETLTQVTSSGCLPILPNKGAKRCNDLMSWAYETLIPNKHFDTIIVSANWEYVDHAGINNTIHFLEQYTDKIVVLGPSMQYTQALPRLLVSLPEDANSSQIYKTAGKYKVVSLIDRALKVYFKLDKVTYISTLNILCNGSGCRTLTPEGIPMNMDEGHLTHEGALYILEHVIPVIFDRQE